MIEVGEGIIGELQFFVISFGWGFLVAGMYSIFYPLRYFIPHNTLSLAIEDFFYWLVTGILIFSMIYKENDGAVRCFALVALLLGMLLYLCIIRKVKNLLKKLQK